jgi:PAS domain-containing protein
VISGRCNLASSLSDLIGSIYDCALDPSRWDRTLADIKDALDCHGITLTLSDLRYDHLLLQKAAGLEAQILEQLPKHAPEMIARQRDALASWPSLDEPLVVSRHFSPAYVETSPYFQEWARPTGIVDTMAFFLVHTPLHLAGLYLGRNERLGIITEREIELGKLLLPHLRRAVTISKVLDVRTIERTRMAEALDALRCAVVLTNEHGSILHANRAAEI